MILRGLRLMGALALMAALAGGGTARADGKYSIEDLGLDTFTKLNNRGRAIGWGLRGTWEPVGVYYDGESTRELGGGFMPHDLNDHGQIVGTRRPDPEAPWESDLVLREAAGTERRLGEGGGGSIVLNNRGQVLSGGFEGTTIYSPGGVEVLAPGPGEVGAIVGRDLNDAGTVAGFALVVAAASEPPPDFQFRGFVKDEGGAVRMPVGGPAGADAIASVGAINNAGQVVGENDALDSYLFTPGEPGYVKLPFSGGQTPILNDLGQVLGTDYSTGWGQPDLLLYDGGQVFDLRELLPPGTEWTLLGVSDLNNAGQILGTGYLPDGQMRSFLLTPQAVPEPGTLAIGLALAGAAVAWRRSRGRRG